MSLREDPAWVQRSEHVLRPNIGRVISRIYLPGQEIAQEGSSRAPAILERVLALDDAQVADQLESLRKSFSPRHRDLQAIWQAHFALLRHRIAGAGRLSVNQRDLIGAYFTQEFSIESAALFNPSMVQHPDQSGILEGSTRFIMTLRAVGEGHISSIEFRTGVISAIGIIVFDPLPEFSVLPEGKPVTYSRMAFEQVLNDLGGDQTNSDFVLESLPELFTHRDLDRALDELREQRLTRGSAARTIDRFEWIAACSYGIEFPSTSPLQERVIMPRSPDETHGIEDVRMVRFHCDDESTKYFGTYTAYNGRSIASHLIETADFASFDVTQMTGPGAMNKGMALFPRRIGDSYYALSRADRESNYITCSDDMHHWYEPVLIQMPLESWEIVQLGNCGSPIETPAGWLVLTHGVGPMRQYSIGALLLDLEDPTIVIGQLTTPILTATEVERSGYVPNVVYSCGGMLHGHLLVLPYGCSDTETRIALVDLDQLLHALQPSETLETS